MQFLGPIGDGFAAGSTKLVSTAYAMAIIRKGRFVTAFAVIAPDHAVVWEPVQGSPPSVLLWLHSFKEGLLAQRLLWAVVVETRSFQLCCEKPMTLTEARKQFLRHCRSAISLSPHTMRAYTSDFNDTQSYLGVRKKLEFVEKDHLRQYIRHLREHRRFKETTIKRRLASLKLLSKWAMQEEFIKTNPF